ncbi:hypothetical protein IMSHALPRED_004695 [Imshaugia aleurites]|uniref:SET domain-containing protein n=1 Tax=Imshaugia aleurites TaxID=172621 RepID=A0A8H3F6U9_9LECA|nr:hypothetical protein IMSHALPRED_004695 [Imshaugia aleurites]
MKPPPTTGSSGSSTGSKKDASHPIESGVKKFYARKSKSSKVFQATDASHPTGSGVRKSYARKSKSSKLLLAAGGDSPQDEKKWQGLFDSARDVVTDSETVGARLARLLKALREERSKKEAEENSMSDAGECHGFDVKGLMAQIYQDLHNVATAQLSRAASGEAPTGRAFYGELSDTEVFLRDVSAGVTSAIASALNSLHHHESSQSSETRDVEETMARCLLPDDAAHERYGKLATHHGWKFLSKLAHSAAFCNAVCTLDEELWQILSASIDENAVSLMVFVDCCGLEWSTELIRLNSLFPPTLDFTKYAPLKPRKPSPHKWVVTEKASDVHRPTFEGQKQINIPNNIYRAASFTYAPRPPFWPPTLPYPSDPTIVHNHCTKPCINCSSRTPCPCTFATSSSILHPLVELRSYGGRGVGVRALQPIPAGAILGEYVGEVFPAGYDGDAVYALDFSLPGRASEEVIASISARRYGNWTRFMNHSCAAATRFKSVMLGGRYRCVVVAVREIGVFEEVTIDYGDGYWRERRCECGVEGCVEEFKRGEVGREEPEEWNLSTIGYED